MTKMMTTKMENEECWILKGRSGRWWWKARYDRYSVGMPATVAFDYDYVLSQHDSILGWIHTHPNWKALPSSTDDDTMKAWVTCLGKPLLCCIKGTDGLRAWWYMDDESDPVEVKVIRAYGKLFGRNPNVTSIHS